jgi:hypothetical protein
MRFTSSLRLALVSSFLNCLIWASATAAAVEPEKRVVLNLNGQWQVAEGGMTSVPAAFDHQVVVPGLLDMAKPAFVEVGPHVNDRHSLRQKDPRRDAFWYRRTFEVKSPIPFFALLKIGKATYGSRVFLNGKLLGDHAPSYTPGYFDAKDALKPGVNELIVRVGADPDAIFGVAETGFDGEKSRYIPGILDSVELILSGTPHIANTQVVPDMETQSVTVQVSLHYQGVKKAETLHFKVREAKSGRAAGQADLKVAEPTVGDEQQVSVHIPIRDAKLWSPESPFLYELDVEGSADSTSTRFGMRNFKLDPATGHAVLNGYPYFLRGTNVTFYRFSEDAQRGDKPWRDEWVRRLFQSFRDMHWNVVRFSIGFPPESWYRIADEEGILVQDEFPIWTQQETGAHHTDELANEFREWMQERWNHPSVVLWDASNETHDPEIAPAIRKVRDLDGSHRPWDNGWNTPIDPGDSDEVHPYNFIFGPDQPFRMYRLVRDPGTKAGLLIDQPYQAEKLKRSNALILNEYGGLWLNRDGSPSTLSQPIYDYLLGPSATVAQRRHLYARDMAELTEFFRAHRKAAAVMQFSALGYSRSDGQTSDDFIDVEKLTRDPEFYESMRDAFAPVGLMVNTWADDYKPGAEQEFPVLLVNDLAQNWKGEVRFRLLEGEKVLQEKIEPASIARWSTSKVSFTIGIPQVQGKYRVEATLLSTPDGPVHSVREFEVFSAEQAEQHRNLAIGRPVTASSERGPYARAAFAVDDLGTTAWTPLPEFPQWLTVDLGESKSLSHIELMWGLSHVALVWNKDVPSYAVDVSTDGTSWEAVHPFDNHENYADKVVLLDILRFPAVQARYVRVRILKCAFDSGCPLTDIAIYHR